MSSRIIKVEVPVGQIRTMNHGPFTQDRLVDENNDVWIPKGMCFLCDNQILRILRSATRAEIARQQEENLMWGKVPKNICNYCANHLLSASHDWELYFE